MKPYTLSTWVVKPGREDEFLRLWQDFADWAVTENFAQSAMLLRDVEHPNRFVSLGPWHTIDQVGRWRDATGFSERIARLREVLESWEPQTLELVFETS
ncbi:MAG: antibiotic biosynthesis monooxygenase family protein [Gaiellaceae bacterium]